MKTINIILDIVLILFSLILIAYLFNYYHNYYDNLSKEIHIEPSKNLPDPNMDKRISIENLVNVNKGRENFIAMKVFNSANEPLSIKDIIVSCSEIINRIEGKDVPPEEIGNYKIIIDNNRFIRKSYACTISIPKLNASSTTVLHIAEPVKIKRKFSPLSLFPLLLYGIPALLNMIWALKRLKRDLQG